MSDRLAQPTTRHLHPLVLVAAVGVFFGPVLLSRRIFLMGDFCCLFYPAYVFFREHLKQGILPLWNPYAGCGEPFLADVQRSVFYPPNLIYLLLPTTRAIVLVACLHALLAAFGTYALCRTWRISPLGSLVAGLAYAFSSSTIAQVAFPSQFGGIAWLPVVLGAYVLWLKRRNRRSLFLLATTICLQFLAGFPELVGFTLGAAALYALFVAGYQWWIRRDIRPMAVSLGGLGVACLLAVALSLAQLLPTLDALPASKRGGAIDPQLNFGSFPPLGLMMLLLPSVYGVDGALGINYWAPSSIHYSVITLYIGIFPITVLLALAFHRLKGKVAAPQYPPEEACILRSRVPYLLALFTVFLLYAMGQYTPFYNLMRRVAPIIQRFIWPPKCLPCVVLALSCLAAISLDYLSRPLVSAQKAAPGWRAFLARWGTVLIFAGTGFFVVGCLINNGSLAKEILRRYFNMDSVRPEFAPFFPWKKLMEDALKVPVLGIVSAILLQRHSSRLRGQPVVGSLIVLVTFADLMLANAYLLHPGSAAVVEKPSAYAAYLSPPGRQVRFFGFKVIFRDDVRKVMEQMPAGKSVVTLKAPGDPEGEFDPSEFGIRLLRNIDYISWPAADKVFDACSITNFSSGDLAQVTGMIIAPRIPPPARERLMALLNCDRVVLPPNPGTLAKHNITRVVLLDEPMPRAYVVGGFRGVDSPQDAIWGLLNEAFDPWKFALVERSEVKEEVLSELHPGKVRHEVTRLTYLPNALEIEVRSESPGVLVTSETFYPGWTARVNGNQVPVYKVNGAFRGVRVPAGTSTVRMTYWPPMLSVGIAGSLSTLFILLILLIPARRTARSLAGDAKSEDLSASAYPANCDGGSTPPEHR